MLAMAEANGEVAVQDPDQLVKQIERTRENLARTIDTLTERVSPANIAKRALSKLRDQASRPEVQIGAAAVTVVTMALVVWRWRRR
jgi:prefoldin subunit 5